MKTMLIYEGLAMDVEYEVDKLDTYDIGRINLVSVTIQDQSGVDIDVLESGILSDTVLDWIEERCWDENDG